MREQLITTKLLNPQELLTKQLELKYGNYVGDLGCGGAGYFSIPAAKLVGGRGKIYAVDILKSALEGVKSKAKLENILNIETVWSDLERLGATNIPEATLDSALLINILFQSRDNKTLFEEAKRLLKQGGKLLVVDWKIEPTPFGPPITDRMSPEKVRAVALTIGFSEEKFFDAGPYHYGFIFIK